MLTANEHVQHCFQGLEGLTKLQLDNNSIAKIENISHLVRLGFRVFRVFLFRVQGVAGPDCIAPVPHSQNKTQASCMPAVLHPSPQHRRSGCEPFILKPCCNHTDQPHMAGPILQQDHKDRGPLNTHKAGESLWCFAFHLGFNHQASY